MSRLADITVAIQEWVATVVQTPAMATALGLDEPAEVLARLWDSPPPPGAAMPYLDVVVAEPRDVGGVGLAEVMAVALVSVKVVARAEAYEPLTAPAVALHDALHGKTNVPLNGGGTMLSSRRVRTIAYPEISQGVEYRHLGGTYEIHAQ